jgi:hypothetical protein
MAHLSEVVQILTALGLCLTGVSSAVNVVLTLINGRNTRQIAKTIDVIHTQTNGLNEKLLTVTGDAEFAKGLKQGEEHPRDARV